MYLIWGIFLQSDQEMLRWGVGFVETKKPANENQFEAKRCREKSKLAGYGCDRIDYGKHSSLLGWSQNHIRVSFGAIRVDDHSLISDPVDDSF